MLTAANVLEHPELQPPYRSLLEEYWDTPLGYLETFQSDTAPDSNDLANFGSGDGAKYQFLSKFAPAFHVFVTALGMRYLGGESGHWGPLRTHAAEVKKEADDMLLQVQKYIRGRGADLGADV